MKLTIRRTLNRYGRPIPPRHFVEMAREMASKSMGASARDLAKYFKQQHDVVHDDAIYELYDGGGYRSGYSPLSKPDTAIQELRIWLCSST